MKGLFILDGHTPVAIEDVQKWAEWKEQNQNLWVVAQDHSHGHWVSTIFLGIDAAFGAGLRKHAALFETAIFCKHEPPCRLDVTINRCSSWEEAEEMHKEAVAWVRAMKRAKDN